MSMRSPGGQGRHLGVVHDGCMRQGVVRVAAVAAAVALMVFTVQVATTIRSVLLTQERSELERAAVAALEVWQWVGLAWMVMAALASGCLLIAILLACRLVRLLSEPFEPRSPAPHPIGAVMGKVEHRWHDHLDCQGRRLVVKLDPGATATEVPGWLVTQVLDVLIDNALRHGRGDVTLTARQYGETLAVDVEDEGSIALVSAAVFDRGTSEGGGRLSGLALARSMVETHGGRLAVGRRSPATFTLLLPGDTPDVTRPGWLSEQRSSPVSSE